MRVLPFPALLIAGAACSLLAIVARPTATDGSPVPPTSAAAALPAIAEEPLHEPVTELSPAAPAATTTPEILAAAATPTPTGSVDAPPRPADVPHLPAPLPVDAAEAPVQAAALFDRMNLARSEHGADALARSEALDRVALARARSLVENGYFDHYAPDGSSAFSELTAHGIFYRLAGENLARNTYSEARTAGAAFDALMGSPGHRANILEPRFGEVGVACLRSGRTWVYVTVFVAR